VVEQHDPRLRPAGDPAAEAAAAEPVEGDVELGRAPAEVDPAGRAEL
jgi:hypothetical protein